MGEKRFKKIEEKLRGIIEEKLENKVGETEEKGKQIIFGRKEIEKDISIEPTSLRKRKTFPVIT